MRSAMQSRVVPLTLLSLVVMFSTALAQNPGEKEDPKTCNHGGYDLWNTLRMLPVRFTEVDGDTAHWEYQDQYNVKLGSFVLHGKAKLISTDKKVVNVLYLAQRKESNWLCYYCSLCHVLLRAYELKPGSSQF